VPAGRCRARFTSETRARRLAGIPLAEVVLPGTHDSAADALIDTMRVIEDHDP
jgi:hypothetical protein